MENKKIIGRLVKIEIVVEISMKYQKAINYKTHINVGINYNMRCIETRWQVLKRHYRTDKLQHEMY